MRTQTYCLSMFLEVQGTIQGVFHFIKDCVLLNNTFLYCSVACMFTCIWQHFSHYEKSNKSKKISNTKKITKKIIKIEQEQENLFFSYAHHLNELKKNFVAFLGVNHTTTVLAQGEKA